MKLKTAMFGIDTEWVGAGIKCLNSWCIDLCVLSKRGKAVFKLPLLTLNSLCNLLLNKCTYFHQINEAFFLEQDRGDNAKSSTTTLMIMVKDSDDLPPKFTESIYRTKINEFSPITVSCATDSMHSHLLVNFEWGDVKKHLIANVTCVTVRTNANIVQCVTTVVFLSLRRITIHSGMAYFSFQRQRQIAFNKFSLFFKPIWNV